MIQMKRKKSEIFVWGWQWNSCEKEQAGSCLVYCCHLPQIPQISVLPLCFFSKLWDQRTAVCIF